MQRSQTTILTVACAAAVVIIVAAALGLSRGGGDTQLSQIGSFEACAAAGFPVMESYPRRCAVPGGSTYTEVIPPAASSSARSSAQSSARGAANIVITEPAANQAVTSPVTVKGQARVFENTYQYRVRDADGTVLAQGFGTAQSPDIGQFGPLSSVIAFSEPEGERGTIEVFTLSANDGSETDMVVIPVRFAGKDQSEADVFYGSKTAPAGRECEALVTQSRPIPKDASVQDAMAAALRELLRGPQADANAATAIPKGTVLNNVTLDDGIATADFSAQLENYGGGSCNVGLIREQIERTLKQFPGVQGVIISVEGRMEDVLQP
jgi:hypothetical protein